MRLISRIKWSYMIMYNVGYFLIFLFINWNFSSKKCNSRAGFEDSTVEEKAETLPVGYVGHRLKNFRQFIWNHFLWLEITDLIHDVITEKNPEIFKFISPNIKIQKFWIDAKDIPRVIKGFVLYNELRIFYLIKYWKSSVHISSIPIPIISMMKFQEIKKTITF